MSDRNWRSDCPISSALDLFGDKWSLLIMRDLLLRNKSHYREFFASEKGIATNILADRLAKLEAAGLVEKTDDDPREAGLRCDLEGQGSDPAAAIASAANSRYLRCASGRGCARWV